MLLDGYAPLDAETLRVMKVREVYSPINRVDMTAEQLGVCFPLRLVNRKQLRELRELIPRDLTPTEIFLRTARLKGQAKPLHNYAPDSDVWLDGIIGSLYFGGSDDGHDDFYWPDAETWSGSPSSEIDIRHNF